jgi:hypothetical protein
MEKRMIWGKRRFESADYAPYMDRLEKLLMANPTRYREFIMVSTKTSKAETSDYYVGVPHKTLMSGFDGFENVAESDVPKIVDALHLGDNNEFDSRFQFRHNIRS